MKKSIISESLVDNVCKTYRLGKRLTQPIFCPGGLLHRIYQFNTTTGRFIIKILNPMIINRPHSMERYRSTEYIACEFSKYVSAVNAITHQNEPLYSFENKTIMLFPYIHGNILTQRKLTSYHAEKMGHTFATMHKVYITLNHVPDVELPTLNLFYKGMQTDEIEKKIKTCLPLINIIHDHRKEYESILKNNIVISHRDYDPKNVLWDANNQYYLIDWESAGLINKTKDTLVTAIYWSLDDHFKVNLNYLSTFIKSYQKNGGAINKIEISAGLYGLLGDWLSWLDFNLSRMSNNQENSEEFMLGMRESRNTLTAIPLLLDQFPVIIRTIIDTLKKC